MEKYNPEKIEKRWQKEWKKQELYKTPKDATHKNKMYILPQLPYPSGSGLHVGHAEVYTACDIYARFQRMIGKKVLQVIGWDSFGLPAENYAIKTNVHPKKSTNDAIDNFRSQIKALGISVDWDREVGSHNPDYYKFTQWFFLLMYKRGLAYRKKQSVNWCDSCKTVLANEQIVEGKCERCDTQVLQREMEQWYLKITDYADRLIEGLDRIDWPEETKKRQKDWIGRSQGVLVCFNVVNVQDVQNDEKEQAKRSNKRSDQTSGTLEVFTTRPDTLFGATYMVVAPEHELIENLKAEIKNFDEVKKYIEESKKKTDLDRQTQKEKTGVELQGVKAINPVNNEEIPIFIADYVLSSYGTGAIMAVPAHDERDFEFAKKYGLEIKDVVARKIGEELPDAIRRDGVSGVVINKKGQVLVLFNKVTNIYRLPGGGYDDDDANPEKAVLREVAEESGYVNLKVKEYLGQIQENCFSLERKENRIGFRDGFLLELIDDTKEDVAFEEHEDFEEYWLAPKEAIKKLAENPEKYGEDEVVRMAFEEGRRCITEEGIVINSEFLNELSTSEAKEKMIAWLEEKGIGERKVQYKLRDWSVSRQRFWGAPIPMLFNKERKDKKYNYLFIHGHGGTGLGNFRTWLKDELEKLGHSVTAPDMPNPETPSIVEQAEYVLANAKVDKDTVIVAHSLGGPVTFRILEKISAKGGSASGGKTKIAKVVLVDTVLLPEFNDKERPDVEASDSFKFDFAKIKSAADEFVVLADKRYHVIKKEHIIEMRKLLDARLIETMATEEHFRGPKDETILEESIVTGLLPIPETDLPVLLPDDVDFKPTGESPLNYSKDFQKGIEKKYGKGWKREPDTLDTFMCSSWYYYRYLDPHNGKEFAGKEQLEKWMPVDFYLGGEEHVNGHLLYSRFFTKVLYDAGYVSFDEPFTKHRHQGLILGEDHQKMSKRWNNVINPTDVVNEYGADTLRMYEMFMGPLEQTKPWDTQGVKGIRRFLEKVWKLQEKVMDAEAKNIDLTKLVHKTIKKVSEDVEAMRFNTAIASLMEFVNVLMKEEKISTAGYSVLIKLLSPFAPHMAEELWNGLGNKNSVTREPWPIYDPQQIVEDKITLVVQVNGKVRADLEVDADISEDDAKRQALENEKVQNWLEGKEPKKVIYVKDKLVSIVA